MNKDQRNTLTGLIYQYGEAMATAGAAGILADQSTRVIETVTAIRALLDELTVEVVEVDGVKYEV